MLLTRHQSGRNHTGIHPEWTSRLKPVARGTNSPLAKGDIATNELRIDRSGSAVREGLLESDLEEKRLIGIA
jgi:hypothetical protein